jgi:hypothetical protein
MDVKRKLCELPLRKLQAKAPGGFKNRFTQKICGIVRIKARKSQAADNKRL